MTGTVLVLNGPNLNLLGLREPSVYGHDTLDDVVALCERTAARHGLDVRHVQSNHEGELLDVVHEMRASAVGVVVNAGGLSHTSVSLRDALVTVNRPLVEVHVSNVHAREDFRHHSYLSAIATGGVIVGCGIEGYRFAIERIASLVAEPVRAV